MSDSAALPGTPAPESTTHSLTDRVLARVQAATDAASRSARATRPRVARRRLRPLVTPVADESRTPEQVRAAHALRRVFLELGSLYRAYRQRTGSPAFDDVRAAADRFRSERDFNALVSVAESLERHEVLTL